MFILKNNHFWFFLFHLFFLIKILSVDLVVFVSSSTIDKRLEACRPRDCGNGKNISYPFWIDGIHEEYCGVPEFKVTCKNDEPVLRSSGNDYIIRDIFYKNQSFRVENSVEIDSCHPTQNASFTSYPPFKLDPTVGNFSFFYSCTNTTTYPPYDSGPKAQNYVFYPKNCSYTDSQHFSVVTFDPEYLDLDYWNSRCKTLVLVPVEVGGGEINPSIYRSLLDKGFLLEWNKMDCKQCADSGGSCDLFLEVSACICGDQPNLNRCDTDGPGLQPTPLGKGSIKKGIKIAIGICIIGIVIIIAGTYISWRWMAKHIGEMKKNSKIVLVDVDNPSRESSEPSMLRDNPDLKIFNFRMLIIATNNFSESNKLGQGGFGSVYKGELPDGQVIAIKRLSKCSGQGLQEFKNEVVVISKLQHRNLVRLLGYCIAGEEKILIYEYMLNKGLDTYLFDTTKRGRLDWGTRFQIIEGISRGILYLHRDSRLKVIHRDLKPSNILLDEELNPKISDFGMARIFGCNELQANTNRVVGTYGYMSPEYAMEGQFSEKSDVFSFGVLLLEIVSGRRNTSFYNHDHSFSLLNYAWLLWNENKIQSFIEPTLSREPHFVLEIVKCIHVGLLCVQEFANDRPTISTTLFMLTSEITLPTPKQPAFTQRLPSSHSSSHEHKTVSVNTVTLTSVGGR